MKYFRHATPVFGILALIALFLKMPGTVSCRICSSSDPYLPLLGAGYFSLLIAASLLFPTFPGTKLARAGLTWAVLLALILIYIDFPEWCVLCIACHVCHILNWTIWLIAPPLKSSPPRTSLKERLYLMLLAPISIVALFSGLNLTFMAYRFKAPSHLALQLGDPLPPFTAQTMTGRSITHADFSSASGIIINFVSIDCPHCKEQLQVLEAIILQLDSQSYRFINISPTLPSDVMEYSSSMEWVEDREGALLELFRVAGYPTMFIVGTNGKIVQIIPGVPAQLKREVLSGLGG